MSTLGVGIASAQPSVQLNRFYASEQTTDGFAISSAEVQGHLNVGAQLYFDYSNDPLVYETSRGASGDGIRVVEHQLQANVNVSLGILDRLTVFVGIPLYVLENGDSASQLPPGSIDGDAAPTAANANGAPVYLADGFTVGDPYLGARVRILGTTEDLIMLGAQGRITFPVAQLQSGQHYAGEQTFSGHPELILQVNVDPVRIMVNVGAHIRDNVPNCQELTPEGRGPGSGCFTGAAVGDELTWGIGGTANVFENDDHRIMAILEARGRFGFTAFGQREETSIEILAGAKYFHSSGITAGIGGGPGLMRGFGSPDFRVLGMVGYAQSDREPTAPVDTDGDGLTDDVDQCPTEPEDADGFEDANGCPDPDNDSDGVLDGDDSCPMEPEDADGFEDENGCPDPDNDQDGLADGDDSCPNDAEDMDSFEDENGCPDPDNDGDGVLDGDDRCPIEAGPSENNGCPWPDTDGDGIVDPVDSCVDEPGTEEFHGCPEQTEVFIEGGAIRIMDRVYFRTNRATIQRRSFALLDNVVSILQQHPEITHIRIEGHTDSRGRLERNMQLSQERAEAVMAYLVEHGVDASRLEAQGFGPTRPVVENASNRSEHAQNRRVEFNIVESGGAQVGQTDSGPQADTIDR